MTLRFHLIKPLLFQTTQQWASNTTLWTQFQSCLQIHFHLRKCSIAPVLMVELGWPHYSNKLEATTTLGCFRHQWVGRQRETISVKSDRKTSNSWVNQVKRIACLVIKWSWLLLCSPATTLTQLISSRNTYMTQRPLERIIRFWLITTSKL